MAEFESVWDALEEDPVKRENLKIRSELMIQINSKIDEGRTLQKEKSSLSPMIKFYKQEEIANILNITQPRVSALRKGKINEFRLDMLVDIATRLGLHVSLKIAA